MKKRVLEFLACPVCHGALREDKRNRELVCDEDRLAFPIRDGVPVLLEMDARRLDEDVT